MSRQISLPFALFSGCVALCLLVSYPYLFWFFRYLPLHFDFFHGLIAAAILFIGLKQLRSVSIDSAIRKIPILALVCCIIGIAGLWIVKHYTSIRILGFVSSMLIFYGLAGLLIEEKPWRRGLFPFVLLLLTLPFGRHFDIFIGYPLRMFMVQSVYEVLVPFFPDIESYSGMLVMENRASFVDMDCSGLRGLWVSLLIYLLLSWLEPQKSKAHWLIGLLAFMCWMVLGNFIRILLLVLIHSVFDQPQLDPLVHHTTSLIFLLSGCYFAFLWMKRKPAIDSLPKERTSMRAVFPMLGLFIAMASVYASPSYAEHKTLDTGHQTEMVNRFLARGWKSEVLNRTEDDVYKREGVFAFKMEKDSTSLIIVLNGDWRSQHKPELCYESTGFRLKSNTLYAFNPAFAVRRMSFEANNYTAWYWFQSGESTTDDFGQKVWQQLKDGSQEWTLISILHRGNTVPKAQIEEIRTLLSTQTHD